MGVIKGFYNLVKSVATGGREASKIMSDTGYAAELVKRKFIGVIKKLLKSVIYQFVLYGLIIVVVVSAVSVVFEMFSKSPFGNSANLSEVNPRDMKEWSDGLSDEEIKNMQRYGASIHPRKLHLYADIEDKSYQKNVTIKIPKVTVTWGTGRSRSEQSSTADYLFTRGDVAYPYRQWWHSTAGIDAINDSSNVEQNVKIIEDARESLMPIYEWIDPMAYTYAEGSLYNKTSPKEEIIVKTKKVTVKTNSSSSNSGSGGSTTEDYTEVTTRAPLPFLNFVDTMFAKYGFLYKSVTSTNTITSPPSVRTYSDTSYKEVDGVMVEKETTYTETTIESNTISINTWVLNDEVKSYLPKFMDFLDKNKIDTKDDPLVMYYMAESLPQSYDFISQFKDYLDSMDFTGYSGGGGSYTSGSYVGDFGDFSGGLMVSPVPSGTRVSSYFGYRVHPVTRVKMSFHTGIDIPANMGADILSGADGIVSYVGPKGTYGLVVMVNHGGGIETLYAHNSRLIVSPGQSVTRGQVISKAGSTGRSTGPHLHFEVRKNGKAVDPIPWIRSN